MRVFKERAWARDAAEAKEARIELLRKQSVRRVMHRGLVRGWTRWVSEWELEGWLRHCSAEGARRTVKAWKSIGFSSWLRYWHGVREAQIREEALKGYPAIEASLAAARDEAAKLAAEKHALLERLHGLEGGVESADQLRESQLEAERQERVQLYRRQVRRACACASACACACACARACACTAGRCAVPRP